MNFKLAAVRAAKFQKMTRVRLKCHNVFGITSVGWANKFGLF